MTWLEKNRYLILKRDKERRSNYFCSELFRANIPFMVQCIEQFTNNGFLNWYYEDFFQAFSKGSCSKHPEIIKVSFGFMMFSGSIKRKYWDRKVQVLF